MKNISKEFNTVAENPFGAKYILKIVNLTDNTEIKDDINDFVYSAMINDDDAFTIGNTCSATISFSITNPTINLNNKEIEVYQGLNVNGIVEYIKLGIFKVLKPKKDRNITRYQCVDRMTYLMNMPYSSNLAFPTTDVKILEEICTQVDITLVQNGLISHSISKSPSGYTRREIIAYMSQLQGKNAKINSDGNLEIIWYTDANYVIDDNKIYYDGTSDVNSEIDYKVEYLECTVRSLDGTDETVIKAGSGVNGIKIENPFMTQTILYELANKLVGFTFRGAEFEFLGDFRLEVGDIVSVETNGEVYRVPIMQIEHKSDGGVVTTITSIGETDTENEIDLSSPNIHAMDRYYAELVLINKAMINKLSVDEADIRYLQVEQLDVIEANIENAVIENLEGKYVTAEELDAEKARITVLEANSLNADSAIIKDLQAGVTKTNTLIFGSASGDTIQTSFSNSVIAQLGDAQIESAMIKEISALKITGLDLNTSKFTIHSENGRSIWKDNTISMYDDVSGSPRIQIGKDGSGDYNMYIWNAQGKLMFDALGLTENGISRQIIRDDVVKDDANISAGKLNIQSLFSVINNDNSYTLKSSKILIDDEGQTLDISFKTMSSAINGLQTTQTSQGTQLSVIQGNIDSKIWQQDITKAIDDIEVGGRNLLLNSNFTKGSEYWGVSSGASLEIIADSVYGNVAKVTSSSNSAGLFRSLDGRPNIKDNTECVFSFYAKADTEMTLYSALNGSGLVNAKQFTVGTEWVRIVGYFTKTSNNYVPRIYGNGTYYIANVQLELGNVVTDWNIASEDIENDVTSLTTKYSLIEQDLNGFKTTVSETYTTITDFNNLEIGGTNLFIVSTAENGYINTNGTVSKNDKFYTSDFIEIEKGQVYTFSRIEDTTTGSIYDAWRIALFDENKNLIERTAYTELVKTLTFDDTVKYIRVSAGKLSKIKVEKGNKATDWSPAPEDINNNIDNVDAKFSNYSTTSEMTAAIKVESDNITQTVSETYATKNNLNNLTDEIDDKFGNYSTTEQMLAQINLKSDEITQSVSQTYTTIEEFNNLSIGGVNLISGTQYWDFVTNDSYKNKEELDIPYGISNINTPMIEVSEGKKYSVSVDIKSATEYTNNTFVVLYYDETNTRISYEWVTGTVGTEWTKISKIFTTPTRCKYLTIGLRSNPYANTYRHLMLEEGNKVTTWSPNPNDYQVQIEYNKAIATQTADKFNWLVESGTSSTDFTLTDRMAELTAQIINLNGNVKVSGDMLVDGAITAEKLAVDAIKSRNYVANVLGSYLNLEDGSFKSKYLSWDKNGKFNAKSGEIGKWSILTGGGLMAETDTGTEPGTLNRVYLQPFNKENYEDTWVISSQWQDIDSVGNISEYAYPYWYITGGGDFYTEGNINCSTFLENFKTFGNILFTEKLVGTSSAGTKYCCWFQPFTEDTEIDAEILFGGERPANSTETGWTPLWYINLIGEARFDVVSATQYNNVSDRNKKHDIVNLNEQQCIDVICSLNPVSYKFNNTEYQRNHWGFVAQDVENALDRLNISWQDFAVVDKMLHKAEVIPGEKSDNLEETYDYYLRYEAFIAPIVAVEQNHERRIQQLENDLSIANAIIQDLLQQSSVKK